MYSKNFKRADKAKIAGILYPRSEVRYMLSCLWKKVLHFMLHIDVLNSIVFSIHTMLHVVIGKYVEFYPVGVSILQSKAFR